MDDMLGTIRNGDVLFEGDRIAAVGRALARRPLITLAPKNVTAN
jgi:hypothetical protein